MKFEPASADGIGHTPRKRENVAVKIDNEMLDIATRDKPRFSDGPERLTLSRIGINVEGEKETGFALENVSRRK